MTRYVVTPDVAIQLAEQKTQIVAGTQLVAPKLLRSQVPSTLWERVRDGHLTKPAAQANLEYTRGLRIRLLGDRVLQAVAWAVAAELDWPDTLNAEYIALTKLQADALITNEADLKAAASKLVSVASFNDSIPQSSIPLPQLPQEPILDVPDRCWGSALAVPHGLT